MPGKGKPFTSDDSRINRAGRPVNSIDQRWYDLQWWYNLIVENYEELNAAQKVELGVRGLSLLVSKMPTLPATPRESVANVNRAQEIEAEIIKAESSANT